MERGWSVLLRCLTSQAWQTHLPVRQPLATIIGDHDHLFQPQATAPGGVHDARLKRHDVASFQRHQGVLP